MKNDQILSQISEYCRQADMAESTFGRRAVNDGKLVHRLREGKRITIDTLDRIQAYIAASMPGGVPPPRGLEVAPEKRDPRGNFRFFENRQKYLLFVHTCSEKRVTAARVALELSSIHPRPPALRVFDAGVGDGTVLARVMRAMHGRFPHMPFYVAGKELMPPDVCSRVAIQGEERIAGIGGRRGQVVARRDVHDVSRRVVGRAASRSD